MKRIFILIVLVIMYVFVFGSESKKILKGPYLGQKKPGMKSEIFAPDFVSTKYNELNSVFTKDVQEMYFSQRGVPGKKSSILYTKMMDNVWTKPESISFFRGKYSVVDLFITDDNEKMIFCSTKPFKGKKEKKDHDFWISERTNNGWGKPKPFEPIVNSSHEDYFPIITGSGNFYFNSQREGVGTNNIFCAKFRNGKYDAPVKLDAPINSEYREFDAFISSDETMIIFSSQRPGGVGASDIYVSFKKMDGSFAEPKNLGKRINSSSWEYGSHLSPDGKFFFYTSTINGSEDIFWISAQIIYDLNNNKSEQD